MAGQDKNGNLLSLLFFALIAYLLANTGLISDDFIYTAISKGVNISDLLLPKGGLLTMPAENYTHFIWYRFFDLDSLILLNILKILYISVSFYFTAKFFSIYLNKTDSFLASFLFIFFPSHDSTVYWFLGQYLTMTIAFYLYAYYLAYRNRFTPAFLTALAASFLSYASPPIAISLSFIFAINRQFKKGAILLLPNIAYSGYYIFVTKILSSGTDRIPANIDIRAIARQLILQVSTFADSVFGPSMWLKIYYSFFQLSLISIIIGIIATVVFYKTCRVEKKKYDTGLCLGLMVLAALSFIMFAVTGRYPQLAFNLGNRVTIFGSLFIAYLIILLPLRRIDRTLLFSVLFFSILGISDHWKAWSVHQQDVIGKIAMNQELKNVKGNIYVSGNQYSRYGKLSHIEFFSEESAPDPIFNIVLGKGIIVKPLNKRWKYADGYMIDAKYDEKIKVEGYINIYDSQNDRFFKLEAGDINKYIDSLPYDKRHWVQLCDMKLLKNLAVKLMPRLKYALEPS